MSQCVGEKLKAAGLIPTGQRVAIASLLFGSGHRHVTADDLIREAAISDIKLAPATVYNALNQFLKAGLLTEIPVNGSKRYFDTRTESHHHMYFEDDQRLEDLAPGTLKLSGIPDLPDGQTVSGIDVVVRVRTSSD